jgi:hypothetical protein
MTSDATGPIVVYTTRRQIFPRDLPFDVLQPNHAYRWSVETLFAATSVDEVLSGDGLVAIHDRAWSISSERTFTVAPTPNAKRP